MPSITFQGVELKSVSRVAAAATLHLACEFTQAVARPMEWGDMSDAAKKQTMDGQLAGGSFRLTAKPGKQRVIEGTLPNELNANLLTASGFVVTRQQIEGTKGKGVKRRIDFIVKSADADAAAKAEAWITLAGDTRGVLVVNYSAKESGAPGESEEEGEEEGDEDE
jgi:hypothetical protein